MTTIKDTALQWKQENPEEECEKVEQLIENIEELNSQTKILPQNMQQLNIEKARIQ